MSEKYCLNGHIMKNDDLKCLYCGEAGHYQEEIDEMREEIKRMREELCVKKERCNDE